MSEGKFRLVTRSDFDGLACAVLFREMGMIDEIKFVHPKDMQDGTILVSDRDITTNLPYVKGVHLAFDHHLSETIRLDEQADNHIIDPDAPSAARVVYGYYGKDKLPNVSGEMMDAVDKSDSAQFSMQDILEPQGWVLLNYIMDARTGLGRFQDFKIQNNQLLLDLVDYCREHSVDEILEMPDVKERVDLYLEHMEPARDQIKRCTKIHANLAVVDLRYEDKIFAANRFLLYALYPDINISIHAIWGLNKLNTVYAVGKSIVNRTANTNIGELMLNYGGGGHKNAGTCQVDNEDADIVLDELIKKITSEG